MAEHLQQRQLQRGFLWQRFLSSQPPAWPLHHLGKRSQGRCSGPDASPLRALKGSSHKLSTDRQKLRLRWRRRARSPARKSLQVPLSWDPLEESNNKHGQRVGDKAQTCSWTRLGKLFTTDNIRPSWTPLISESVAEHLRFPAVCEHPLYVKF